MSDAVHADDACRLWATRGGDGPPLVFCHGGPGLWDMFGGLAATFADVAAVVRWEQRGCGRSERRGPYTIARYLADLDAVRDRLAGTPVALLGHSWGATLALRYALQHPDRVSHLIYVSGTGIDPKSTWRPAFNQSFRQRLGADLPRWEQLDNRARTPAEDKELAILQWSADFVDEDTAMAHAQDMATPWFEINYECNGALTDEDNQYLTSTDVAAQCRTLHIPTLIIDGARDVRPRWAVDSLHQALPNVRRVTLAGTGHLPWIEDPDGFHEAVTGFLAQTAPTGDTAIHHEIPGPATSGRGEPTAVPAGPSSSQRPERRSATVAAVTTDELARNVVGVWSADGARWLADLPCILRELARDWDLTVGVPYELSYHYVAAVTCGDGTPAVLKLGVPTGTSLAEEAPALAAFAGRGAVRLLRADLDRGALLLERVTPGWRARDLVPDRDSEATSAAVGLMRRLHLPPPPGCTIPDAVAQATAFDNYVAVHGHAGPLPLDLVVRAGTLMRELCASATERVVLHGDLHHDNILRATREPWLAIDPHGIVGDPGYEVGPLLFNPDPADRNQALTALVPARVEQLADELAMPVDRVVAWGFVKAVMSDVWTAEDWTPATRWSPISRALDVARLLLPHLP